VTNKYNKYYSPKQMKTDTSEGKLRKETKGSQMKDILNPLSMASKGKIFTLKNLEICTIHAQVLI